jgi:hypothetical protein
MVRAKSIALTNSGRTLIRVLIFSEKTGSHPASARASSWLWSSCWAVLHLAYPTLVGFVAASGSAASTVRPLPRAAGAAVGGGLHLQLGAELGHQHEARGVVLRGDLAAAGAAGASGGHFTGGAVELFDDGGRFGELWHVAEPIAKGFVRKLFCERL